MKQTITTTHICGRCKCELPLEEFYINKKSQRPDNYCKECRKETSRTQRKNSKASNSVEETRKYPVITEIQDRESRMKLIMHDNPDAYSWRYRNHAENGNEFHRYRIRCG